MKNGLKHKNDEEELLRDWEKYCRSRKIRQRKSFKNYTLKMKLKYDKKKRKLGGITYGGAQWTLYRLIKTSIVIFHKYLIIKN